MKGKARYLSYEEDGEPHDAGLHDDILEGDHDDAIDVSRDILREQGWSKEEIDNFFAAEEPTQDAAFKEEEHPREASGTGRFTGGGGGNKANTPKSKAPPKPEPKKSQAAIASPEEQRQAAAGFVGYQQMIGMIQGRGLPEGTRNPTDIMLEHGRQFPFDADSFKCKKGRLHQCYRNAGLNALHNRDLTYVEGHVLVHGVPIEHAWTVDKNGKVIDPTIRDPKGVSGYIGLPIKTEYLTETMVRTKQWGVLDPMFNAARLRDDPKDYVKPDIGIALPKQSAEEKRQMDQLMAQWRGGQTKDQEAPVPLDRDLLELARGAPTNMIQQLYGEQARRNASRLPVELGLPVELPPWREDTRDKKRTGRRVHLHL